MDWDFIIAMFIVAAAAVFMLYRLTMTIKHLWNAAKGEKDVDKLCCNCPVHDKCSMNRHKTVLNPSVKVRIKDKK